MVQTTFKHEPVTWQQLILFLSHLDQNIFELLEVFQVIMDEITVEHVSMLSVNKKNIVTSLQF